MGSKLLKSKSGDSLTFWCPGCKTYHAFQLFWTVDDAAWFIKAFSRTPPIWHFNDNFEKPTFSPSLLYTREANVGIQRCHLFLRDGQIQFLSDCDHELAGKTVPLEEHP